MSRGNLVIRYVAGGLGLAYGVGAAVVGLIRTDYPVAYGLIAAVATAAYAIVLVRDAGRTAPMLLVVIGVAAGVLHGLSPYSGLAFAYMLPWLAAFTVGLPVVVVIGLTGTASVVVASLLTDVPGSATTGVTLGLLFTYAFAVVIRQLSVVRERTEAAATARADAAVLAERQRLARDIHDVLAHSLSAQILHLEGARLLLERGGPTDDVLTHVRRAATLARAGLVETRHALGALRGEDRGVAAELASLAQEFRSATGLACDVSMTGDVKRLSAEAGLTVVRTAQEALTNIRRHAVGAPATVELRCGDEWCELEVADPGQAVPASPSSAGPGYGLVGMRERAELVGGSLLAGPSGAGFRVLLRLPVAGAVTVSAGETA